MRYLHEISASTKVRERRVIANRVFKGKRASRIARGHTKTLARLTTREHVRENGVDPENGLPGQLKKNAPVNFEGIESTY